MSPVPGISLVGYFNRTKLPYKYTSAYTPFAYDILQLPDGFTMPANPQINVDSQTGMVYIRENESDYWTPMDVKVTDRTFVKSTSPDNGMDVTRRGAELIVDFPEITPIRTQFRVDAAYTYTKYIDNSLSYYYQNGWSHTDASLPNRSYQYVGIYANGDNSSITANGRRTHSLDANITAITRIPKARLIISRRLEALTSEAFAAHLRNTRARNMPSKSAKAVISEPKEASTTEIPTQPSGR